MSNKPIDKVRPFLLLAAFLLAWWFLPAGLKVIFRNSFNEFHAPLLKLNSYSVDLQQFWGLRTNSKNSLIEQGIDLSRENAALKTINNQSKQEKLEINRLEKLLELKPVPGYKYIHARVAKRNISSWWQEITIRKGKLDGILLHAPVIFEGGIVGQVTEVFTNTSVIRLITSRNFRMAANFEGDLRPATYQGGNSIGFGSPKGNVKDAPSDISVSAHNPRLLVSSKLGSVFPGGLVIGKVDFLEPGSNGLFQDGIVHLDSRLLHLQEVTVLIANDK